MRGCTREGSCRGEVHWSDRQSDTDHEHSVSGVTAVDDGNVRDRHAANYSHRTPDSPTGPTSRSDVTPDFKDKIERTPYVCPGTKFTHTADIISE